MTPFSFARWRPRHLLLSWIAYWFVLGLVTVGPAIPAIWRATRGDAQAIASLLTTYEPAFLRMGHSLFLAFATIVIAWQGVRMMLVADSIGDHVFGFVKTLLVISFGYAIVTFYESPIPGIGVSFSNLVTDQTDGSNSSDTTLVSSSTVLGFSVATTSVAAVRSGA